MGILGASCSSFVGFLGNPEEHEDILWVARKYPCQVEGYRIIHRRCSFVNCSNFISDLCHGPALSTDGKNFCLGEGLDIFEGAKRVLVYCKK